MAGLNPDVPARRFAYDVDGSLVRVRNVDLTFKELTQAQKTELNNESGDYTLVQQGSVPPGSQAGIYYTTFVFPELRDIAGYQVNFGRNNWNAAHNPRDLQWSADTIDGSDGTWTTAAATWAGVETATPWLNYRTITALTLPGVKGLRFGHDQTSADGDGRSNFGFYDIMIYGTVVGATTGLRFWAPVVDQEMLGPNLDFGDMPAGEMRTKTFRLRNNSALTANNVALSAVAGGAADAGLASGLTFSTDNITFAATITLPTLAPATTSPLLYVRRTVPAGATPLNRSARIQAIPASFT